MQEKTRELTVVNFILFALLVVLGILSFGGNGTLNVFSPGKAAVYKVETEEKVVAVMCNIYWGTEYVQPLLDLFEEYNVKATFFIGGIWAKDNPELISSAYLSGHEIGNHGYNHLLCTRASRDEVRREISTTDDILIKITGQKPVLFAPPSGDYSESTLDIASSLGYRTIMWSIDTIDWRDRDKNKIASRITRNLQPGAFILTHPTAETVAALKEVLPAMAAQGYQFCTVSELLTK